MVTQILSWIEAYVYDRYRFYIIESLSWQEGGQYTLHSDDLTQSPLKELQGRGGGGGEGVEGGQRWPFNTYPSLSCVNNNNNNNDEEEEEGDNSNEKEEGEKEEEEDSDDLSTPLSPPLVSIISPHLLFFH